MDVAFRIKDIILHNWNTNQACNYLQMNKTKNENYSNTISETNHETYVINLRPGKLHNHF